MITTLRSKQQLKKRRVGLIPLPPGVVPSNVASAVAGLNVVSDTIGGIVAGIKGNIVGAVFGSAQAVVGALKALSLFAGVTGPLGIGLMAGSFLFSVGGFFGGGNRKARQRAKLIAAYLREAERLLVVAQISLDEVVVIAKQLEVRENALAIVTAEITKAVEDLPRIATEVGSKQFAYLSLQGRTSLLESQLAVQNRTIVVNQARMNQLKVELNDIPVRIEKIRSYITLLEKFPWYIPSPEIGAKGQIIGPDYEIGWWSMPGAAGWYNTVQGLNLLPGLPEPRLASFSLVTVDGQVIAKLISKRIPQMRQDIENLDVQRERLVSEVQMLEYQITDWSNRRSVVLDSIESTKAEIVASGGNTLTLEGKALQERYLLNVLRSESLRLNSEVAMLTMERDSRRKNLEIALAGFLGVNQLIANLWLEEMEAIKFIVDETIAYGNSILQGQVA